VAVGGIQDRKLRKSPIHLESIVPFRITGGWENLPDDDRIDRRGGLALAADGMGQRSSLGAPTGGKIQQMERYRSLKTPEPENSGALKGRFSK